jgi:hypothetical protein
MIGEFRSLRRGLVVIKVAALLFGLCIPVLYGQTPTPTEPGNKPKKQSTQEKKTTTTDKRGTNESPLVIKVLPTQDDEKQPEKIPKEQEDHPTDYGCISDSLLALFTGGLFFATWKLWQATERLVPHWTTFRFMRQCPGREADMDYCEEGNDAD